MKANLTKINLNFKVIGAMAMRTLKHSGESLIAYIFALFFYSFLGVLFAADFFDVNQASISSLGVLGPWILWFVVPALTMGLISDEIRVGTFEALSTLPVRDWEIVLGKYIGFVILAFFITLGLIFYPIMLTFLTSYPKGIDWGGSLGILGGLFLVQLFFGSMGLFASSLTKNQVVAFIIGVLFCTIFFLVGQFYHLFPGFLVPVADFIGISSHLNTLFRGVWDVRDLFYFFSMSALFLYLTVLRLSTRRF